MADYYPLLARAIAGLPSSTRESRAAIYERARNALINQLRSVSPPIAEADIEVEREALDSAARRLEDELNRPAPTPASSMANASSAASLAARPAPRMPARPAPSAPITPREATATARPAPAPVRPAPTRPLPRTSSSLAPGAQATSATSSLAGASPVPATSTSLKPNPGASGGLPPRPTPPAPRSVAEIRASMAAAKPGVATPPVAAPSVMPVSVSPKSGPVGGFGPSATAREVSAKPATARGPGSIPPNVFSPAPLAPTKPLGNRFVANKPADQAADAGWSMPPLRVGPDPRVAPPLSVPADEDGFANSLRGAGPAGATGDEADTAGQAWAAPPAPRRFPTAAKIAPNTAAKPLGANPLNLLSRFGRARVEDASAHMAALEPAHPDANPFEELDADADWDATSDLADADSSEPHLAESENWMEDLSEDRNPTRLLTPRADGVRPQAPQVEQDPDRHRRHMIVASVVGAVVLAVAITAFVLRDRPEDLARAKPADPVEQTTPSKLAERVGGNAAPAPARRVTPSAPNADGSAVTSLPQRAAILVQSPTATDPQAISTYVGTVTWRTDSVPGAPGQPNSTAIRADIDLPDAKVRASLTIQQNLDESLPASHLIDLRFTLLPGSVVPAIRQIDTIQMRREDTPAGDALNGVARPVRDNFFFIALTRGPAAVGKNVELMKNRAWIDIPMALSDGRLAKVTFEKGPSGERVFQDAMAAWKQL